MCGRFVSASTPDQIATYFEAVRQPDLTDLGFRYNVAPTDDVYAVLVDGGERQLETLHWGLVPFWAKDPSVGSRMINARADTLSSKSAYKEAFRKRRCIIPADGFYEWQPVTGQKVKQPYFIHLANGEPMGFAGLWAVWRNKADPRQRLHSCTIVTGAPNAATAEVHDRMPVILPRSAWDEWLSPEVDDLERLSALLVPVPPSEVELRPVSTEVNSVKNDGPHLIERVEPGPVAIQTSFDELRR